MFQPVLVRAAADGSRVEKVLELPFERVFADGVDLDSREKRLICAVPVIDSDVWLVENFDSDSTE
jgi:hypothetical protein